MNYKKFLLITALLIAFHIFLLIKLKFTAWPEMQLWPYLITKGWLPYKDIAVVHTPILLIVLSGVYNFFGSGIEQLRLFTWGLILASDILIVYFSRRLWGNLVSVISLAFFVFLSTYFDGNGLWFDLALIPFAISVFYFVKSKKYFIAGILWALAFFTKQTAVWFLIPIAFEIWQERKLQKSFVKSFSYSVILLSMFFGSVLMGMGLLKDFFSWAVEFGILTLPQSEGQIKIPNLKNLIICSYPFLVFIPLLLAKKKKDTSLLIWSLAGALGAYSRFEYFHFLPAVPFISMAGGIAFSKLPKAGFVKSIYGVFVFGLITLFSGYFIRNYNEGIRFYESDVREVSDYLIENTTAGDKILVLNWWDNVYVFTGTLPATRPFVPQLEWYQNVQGIQEREIYDLQLNKPEIIVVKPYYSTGLAPYIPDTLYSYILSNYKVKQKINGVEILTLN